MGHQVDASRMLGCIARGTKTTDEVRKAIREKTGALVSKIEERKIRIAKIKSSNELSDLDVSNLMVEYHKNQSMGREVQTYSLSNSRAKQLQGGNSSDERIIGAGVVASIVAETNLIESEQNQVSDLRLIDRNMLDVEVVSNPRTGEWVTRQQYHKLSDEALKYLGFAE